MSKIGGFSRLFRGTVLAVAPVSCIAGLIACSTDDPRSGCGQTSTEVRPFDLSLHRALEAAYCRDAGTGEPLDCPHVLPADGGSLFGSDCDPYCGNGFDLCKMVSIGEASCSTVKDCTGRRPEGFPASGYANDLRGYFNAVAVLEAASVPAFERLARELEAHGGPRELVRAARSAKRDEIRHAKIVGGLAKKLGGETSHVAFDVGGVRDLEAVAIENAVEGCVRETMGALIAAWQAEHATDDCVREAMRKISRDEARHAELAFEVARWIDEKLDADQRARVEVAQNEAIAELFESWSEPSLDLRKHAGLPMRREARALFERVAPSLGLV